MLVPWRDVQPLMFHHDDEAVKSFIPDVRVVDPALMNQGQITVWGSASKKRKRTQGADEADPSDLLVDAPNEVFFIGSPLFDGKSQARREEVLDNLHPFWGVTRCTDGTSHNMELEYFTFEVHPITVCGSVLPMGNCSNASNCSKSAKWYVEVPVLRNTRRIAEGELLKRPVCDLGSS